MRTSSLLFILLVVTGAACRSHTDGSGSPLDFAMRVPGPNMACAPAGVMEGASEVHAQAWTATRELKRKGAWLALGLRVEGKRVRLLTVHKHEGTGGEAGPTDAEGFRSLLEWALYRYAREETGEVVLTLRRGEGMWREEEDSTGPVLSATLLDTYAPPPRRLAPGYLLSESPLREQSLRALGNATLAWAYAHTEDPDFLKRTPDEVALYLLASRSALASAVQLGRMAPVHLDYNEAFDPEVYKPEELLVEVLVGLTPGSGEVADARAAVTGRSITEHRLTSTERMVCALAVLVPFVAGSVLLRGGDEGVEQLALLTGRSLDEVRVLSRVASHLSPGDAKEIERLMAAASRGHSFTEEEFQFLQRVARGLEAPLREAAGALKAGQKVPLLGVRMLPDGSRLLPGTPAHKAQRWVDYQFRHPEKYHRFTFQPDSDWERMYESILKNRPAGNAFEDAILQAGRYERNSAMMMPPPGGRAQGFIPDSVKGNPAELVWGQPYPFVEAKARQKLSLSGNLEAMIDYVEKYGGHIELWVRSARHTDGLTLLSGPLLRRLKGLEALGRASIRRHPIP
ncbi:pre-toxin TG domain-containing protein [Archangium lansingense]|uniref:pre-toxin TG domain-containing protein n=1 Tax=Archangium lansingense TaxID=2995310 RepID=UPI003B79618F